MALMMCGSAAAQDREDDEYWRWFQPPPSLPESINGVVRSRETSEVDRIDEIRDVFRALQACWARTSSGGHSGQEITLRLSFKRSGEVLGRPRITYYKPGGDGSDRDAFTRSVRGAFERCTPLPFTARFAAAVAGRPFTFRFVDDRPL